MTKLLFYFCIYTFLLGFFSYIYYFFAKIKLTNEDKIRLLLSPPFIWAEKKEGIEDKISYPMLCYSFSNLTFFLIIICFRLVPFEFFTYQETLPENANSDDMAEGVAYAFVNFGGMLESFLANVVTWATLILGGVFFPFLIILFRAIFSIKNK